MIIEKLEVGMSLKSENEFYEVVSVSKNGMIVRIKNLYYKAVTVHTIEEISKYFITVDGYSIKNLHEV